MGVPVGVPTCSSLIPELRNCCQQLGLPVRLHAHQPTCLFEGDDEALPRVVRRAAERHGKLILALGRCCGDVEGLARAHGAAALSAESCAEILAGAGTYGWCVTHGVLVVSAGYGRAWMRQAKADAGAARSALGHQLESCNATAIAAIGRPPEGPEAQHIASMAESVGRATSELYTGLGHLRQALRAAAEEAGIPTFLHQPAPIDPLTLGPGDQCLVLTDDRSGRAHRAATLIAEALRHGVRCVWVGGEASEHELPPALAAQPDDETGETARTGCQIVSAESVLADAGAETSPQQLVDYWVGRGLKALAKGSSGICVIHGSRWGEQAGLGTEYLLEYSSRLSAACLDWPIMAVSEADHVSCAPHILDELMRTHPLTWNDVGLAASAEFECASDYLGGEELLASLSEARDTIGCRELAVLVSAFADEELGEGPSAAVARHVDGCSVCQGLVTNSREMTERLRSLRAEQVPTPPDLWGRARAAIDSDPEP